MLGCGPSCLRWPFPLTCGPLAGTLPPARASAGAPGPRGLGLHVAGWPLSAAWRGRGPPAQSALGALQPRGLASMVPSEKPEEPAEPAGPGPGREQRAWRCLAGYLCFYGFMVQLRPGESFITPYLLSEEKNFTRQQARGPGRGPGDGAEPGRGPAAPAPPGPESIWRGARASALLATALPLPAAGLGRPAAASRDPGVRRGCAAPAHQAQGLGEEVQLEREDARVPSPGLRSPGQVVLGAPWPSSAAADRPPGSRGSRPSGSARRGVRPRRPPGAQQKGRVAAWGLPQRGLRRSSGLGRVHVLLGPAGRHPPGPCPTLAPTVSGRPACPCPCRDSTRSGPAWAWGALAHWPSLGTAPRHPTSPLERVVWPAASWAADRAQPCGVGGLDAVWGCSVEAGREAA
ncbi:Folate transporter 1 [Galemys pyrenaicus]|uniref:Folate transporter 1 n=1 Tax=Galemys pyrenaicus TaxID=202257 RepID=A0A8J6ATF1_GALPY|nr:Folate transporter 1 [Galemys pyrenaicus]